MKPAVALLLTSLLALSACETATAYGPSAPQGRVSGFWDQRIEQHRFRVAYRGGDGAPAAQVEDYALLHAADVTVSNGDEWFQVVQRYGSAAQGAYNAHDVQQSIRPRLPPAAQGPAPQASR